MSAFVLKLIALVSMVTDHTAALLLPLGPTYIHLRCFGRMAFLIYAFLLTEGFRHTRSAPRYARRLFLMGALAQIPYAVTLNAGFQSLLERFTHLNIFFTLGCGVLLMMFLQSNRLPLSQRRPVWGLLPLAMPSNRPTASSSASWSRPGTYRNRGMAKMRMRAAASSRTAVTKNAEIRPGLTAFQPKRLI